MRVGLRKVTLIYFNRTYSLRIYLSYRKDKMRLAVIQYGRIPQIIGIEEDVMEIMRKIKDSRMESGEIAV